MVQGRKSSDDKTSLPRMMVSNEEYEQFKKNARATARNLADAALTKGAQSPNSTGQKLDPCGLDIALDAIFGEDMSLIEKPKPEEQ